MVKGPAPFGLRERHALERNLHFFNVVILDLVTMTVVTVRTLASGVKVTKMECLAQCVSYHLHVLHSGVGRCFGLRRS